MQKLLVGFVIGFALTVISCNAEPPTATPNIQATVDAEVAAALSEQTDPLVLTRPTPPVLEDLVEAVVVGVVDGDTIDVAVGIQLYRVRYIGMDTPESGDFFGPEATAFNTKWVEGKTVYLERDVSETDRFGRLLRYVWLNAGTMINAVLIDEGYALAASYSPDTKYASVFLEKEAVARKNVRGMWGVGTQVSGSAGCHPAYPDVCIPPPPPDLDCKDIQHRRFTVLASDPHRFDGDKNGVGCES